MAKLLRKLYLPLAVLVMELVARLQMTEYPFFSVSLAFVALFSIAWGFFLYSVKPLTTPLFALTCLYFCIQSVYRTIFSTYATTASSSGAFKAVSQYWREALEGILRTPHILVFIGLFILWAVFFRREIFINRWLCLILSAVFHASAVLAVLSCASGVMSPSAIYRGDFVPKMCAGNFGIMTSLRLDIQHRIFPETDFSETPSSPSVPAASSPSVQHEEQSPETEKVREYNVSKIDFGELAEDETRPGVKRIHDYFASSEPSEKNEYTGIFKGKNLIWICAEAFSSWAIDETHTPTLSKLASSGFVFENFYNPLWDVSTSDGEYVISTSLLPESGTWSFSKSAYKYMPYGMGSLMGERGYMSLAYHNNDYEFYARNRSYPNLGYMYKGYGNGLAVTHTWPESDLEMMELSCEEYVGSGTPFCVWYMTVSGHLNYSYNGNYMVRKHWDGIQDLIESGMSKNAAGYIGSQMEFDSAVSYLLDRLEAEGVLDDTVIVISGDHYPYGLSPGEISELNGGDVEENFELYRSTLIIWNSEIGTVKIPKYCCSMDILPTLLNLFGFDYDSRLLMGRDILSPSEPLIVFNNRSWISGYGRYNSITDTYEGEMPFDGYPSSISEKVLNMFAVSSSILDNDYYLTCIE